MYSAHVTHVWWAVTLVCCILSIPLPLCFDRKSLWEQRFYWFHLSSHHSSLDTMDSRENEKWGEWFAESLMQGVRWKSVVSHYTSQSRGATHSETHPNKWAGSSCSPHNFCTRVNCSNPMLRWHRCRFISKTASPSGLLVFNYFFFPTDVSTAADLNAGTALIKIVFPK